MKKALIIGVGGQDGSYLAEFLIEKGYEVFGFMRANPNEEKKQRIAHLMDKIKIIEGDITNKDSLVDALKISMPDEIYNLAGLSSVGRSWEEPVLVNEINHIGVIKLFEVVKKIKPDSKVYQASSSEMFGDVNVDENGINENSKFNPKSPYAISKLAAHLTARIYREAHKMFICCGILFNHESPRRSINFVTRKITQGVAKIKLGLEENISLGNLDVSRDWGFSGDYVEAMWLMLQQENPEDYIIATGQTHSLKDFIRISFESVGINDWEKYVKQDERFMRPSDIKGTKGDSRKAKEKLEWESRVSFEGLVKMMVENDLDLLEKE